MIKVRIWGPALGIGDPAAELAPSVALIFPFGNGGVPVLWGALWTADQILLCPLPDLGIQVRWRQG